MRRPYKLQVYQSPNDYRWYWRIRAPNGEVTCASECYESRSKALRAARRFLLVVEARRVLISES